MATKTILLDIGGTFIKRSDGLCIPVPSAGSAEDIAAALQRAVDVPGGAAAAGVAIPGPFDYGQGVFLMRHKFASVYGRSFRDLAGLPDTVELRFMHDVNALLAGALCSPELKGGDAALVTIGTGLGFACAKQGKVFTAPGGSPAISLWNRPSPDGGILEDHISARALTRAYKGAAGKDGLTPLEIAELARSGDAQAAGVYLRMGRQLAAALLPLMQELGTKVLLLGGQISRSSDLFIAPLRAAMPWAAILDAPADGVFKGLESLFNTTE